MKKFIIWGILVLLLLLLITCFGLFQGEPQGEVYITSWGQCWGVPCDVPPCYLYIYYNVKNTGNVPIEYQKVYFLVTLDLGTWTIWHDSGWGISPGETESFRVVRNPCGPYHTYHVIAVELGDYVLE